MLIVNADDLGCTKEITDRILICYNRKRIHSASAMTFMIDSERAANLAREIRLPVGLHLNLTQDFTGESVPANARDQHRLVAKYLKARKVNQVLYNPLLRSAFDYTFQAQWNEFYRLYGEESSRIDGHHHMHLCMNMLLSGRLPKGIKIRRNFTFRPGEKDPINRLYRYLVDRWLKSNFLCTDFFFSMAPIDIERLKQIVMISKSTEVELMVHPGLETEYSFLLSSEWSSLISESISTTILPP
ncbi:MAG: ChbG/HpnK family deacetylase [Syntrophaceae bacterium]